MRPIVLRDEDPPDDATVVVRGGLLSPESVQRTAERCRREYGFLGLSVYGAIGITVAELVATVPQVGPTRYRQLRLSTFGLVRMAGFAACPTKSASPLLDRAPDVDGATLERLDACFGPPESSPALPDI